MCEIVKIGPVASILGPIKLPEFAEQMVFICLADDDKLYAISAEIYHSSNFYPNDNISFVIKDPKEIKLNSGDRDLPIIYGIITYFKKYKGVVKKCRHL